MSSASLAVEWTLRNSGEDAYWVRLDLDFPPGLSFRKVEMLQVSLGSFLHWLVFPHCTWFSVLAGIPSALWVTWIA